MSEHGKSCCTPEPPGDADLPHPLLSHHAPPERIRPSADLVLVAGGTFQMGSDAGEGFVTDGEAPAREVAVDAFQISRHLVTNHEFAEFVRATGYRTLAEVRGSSHVFRTPQRDEAVSAHGLEWWADVGGASWQHPGGPGTSASDVMDHPVVHVSWQDATAYCAWRGGRLPSEAEWEYAARGGLHGARYPWGDERTPNGRWLCNIWQGEFPYVNTGEDGWVGTSPVGAYPGNGFGIHDVAGNVWEWCADWFSADFHARHVPGGTIRNPAGPDSGRRRVTRGGSFLCHDSYCNRYRVAARSGSLPRTTAANLGFRFAADVGLLDT